MIGQAENLSMMEGFPDLELVCYKEKSDLEAKTILPLSPSAHPQVTAKGVKKGDAVLVSIKGIHLKFLLLLSEAP